MSGIVRKVDELGRIVIPKELRKSLNIKNSDDLEIKIYDNKITLEKFYRLKNLKTMLNNYFKLLDKFLDSDFILTDKETVIITSKKYNDLKDNKIGTQIFELIDSRKQVLENTYKSLKISNIEISKNYYFCPIIIDTDILGSVILLNDNKITEKDLLVVDIFVYLLKEKLE